jgi:two-component system sensor histidine kinase/response regulator
MNAEPRADKGYLLVVDDNENNRDLLSRRLMMEDFETVCAESGMDALEVVEKEPVDLVLLDVMMPGISGLDVLKKLRESYSLAQLPVIMVTAKNSSENVVEALEMGANDYVTKPIDMAVLLARVGAQMDLLKLTKERDDLLKTKDEFLSIASHDLKNPLTAIMGLAMVIKEILPPGEVMTEEMTDYVSRIMQSTKTMQTIIEDFLDFQAMDEGRLKIRLAQMDLNGAVRSVVLQNSDYAVGKGAGVEMELDEAADRVKGDEKRLSQVLQNFIGNSIKFGPNGNVVTVRTWPSETGIVLEVSDQGPGLTEEDMKKVFQKYARLSNKPTGSEKSSGLGLNICKQLVEQHGGEVGVYNNDDRGATFWFSLPFPDQAEQDASDAEKAAG